jgi:hypothetical protein
MPLKAFNIRAMPMFGGLVKQFQYTDSFSGAEGVSHDQLREQFVKKCMAELGNMTKDSHVKHNSFGNPTVQSWYSSTEHTTQHNTTHST